MRQFPKTVPSMPSTRVAGIEQKTATTTTTTQCANSETPPVDNHQRRSQSVSDLDAAETTGSDSSNQTDSSRTAAINAKASNFFERLSTSRLSANNLNTTTANTTGTSKGSPANSQCAPRSSFNSHQSTGTNKPKTTTTTTANASIEYACFNIKPSQYKQTGIFLPINNSSASSFSKSFSLKQQLNIIHLLKEDLELLIQSLRNLHKQRDAETVAGGSLPRLKDRDLTLDGFYKKTNEFIDKYETQLNTISLIELSLSATTDSAKEFQSKLRQLSISIKSILNSLQSTSMNDSPASNVDSMEANFGKLSKQLNEFKQNLDKFNSLLIQQTLVLKQ